MIEPYLYNIGSPRRPEHKKNRLAGFSAAKDRIPLTGWVHGLKASDLEERTYRGAKNSGLTDEEIKFQVPFRTALPFAKNLDFVLKPGRIMPLEVDGPIGHTNSAQLGKDAYREALLNTEFIRIGWRPLTRIKWYYLRTQFHADQKLRSLLV